MCLFFSFFFSGGVGVAGALCSIDIRAAIVLNGNNNKKRK